MTRLSLAVKITAMFFMCFFCASCAQHVATQKIPLSTEPPGARVYVDGKQSGHTPCAVELERNQDHLITFQKDGFRQQDVSIRRQHETETTLLKAINSGVSDAKFFKDPVWGLNSAVQSLQAQKASGEAYVLAPSTVSLKLVPKGGFPPKSTDEEAERSLEDEASAIDLMDSEDEHMLENALEGSTTGHHTVWKNSRTGYSFAVQPEDAKTENGFVSRYFTLGARKDGRNIVDRYPAYRTGRGQWVVGNPPAGGASSTQTGSKPKSEVLGAARALAESTTPPVGKDWKVKESSHSSTTRHSDGSITKRTKSTSTKVGVSVNPAAAALGILDALQSLDDK